MSSFSFLDTREMYFQNSTNFLYPLVQSFNYATFVDYFIAGLVNGHSERRMRLATLRFMKTAAGCKRPSPTA